MQTRSEEDLGRAKGHGQDATVYIQQLQLETA
jgi:hypothetical protein